MYDNIVLHTNFSLFVRIISTIADGEEKPEVQCFMEDKMSVQLLDKTRKINKLLHKRNLLKNNKHNKRLKFSVSVLWLKVSNKGIINKRLINLLNN